MNKRILVLALALAAHAALHATSCCVPNATGICDACDCKSHGTFFSVRPQFQGIMPERQTFMHNDRLWVVENGKHGVFSLTLFGGISENCGRYAAFFGPSCGNSWIVAEDTAQTTDIRPQYFNLHTKLQTFESKISFAPQQRVFGFGLHYKQALIPCDKDKGFFIEISSPIEYVQNTMGFTEEIINDGGGALDDNFVSSMAEAFVQPAFEYGRIYASNNCKITLDNTPIENGCDHESVGCSLTRWGLADIDVRLGYECIKEAHINADAFVGVLIPTGNKPHAHNVFEPIVGHNHHAGFSFGSYAGAQIWENECQTRILTGHVDLFGLYLFKNTQIRLIDVYNKPWSHYMAVYANKEQAAQAAVKAAAGDPDAIFINTPGVNVFAQKVCVNPGFQLEANASLIFAGEKCEAEIGCNFFSRQAECVKLACCWKEGPAFKENSYDPDQVGGTNNVQTIGNFFGDRNIDPLSQYQANIIQESDLDLDSAAHPNVFTYTIYGALGYHYDACTHQRFAGIGGSWEFDPYNAGLARWLLWAKAGVSF